jgi:hypothetical protein
LLLDSLINKGGQNQKYPTIGIGIFEDFQKPTGKGLKPQICFKDQYKRSKQKLLHQTQAMQKQEVKEP